MKLLGVEEEQAAPAASRRPVAATRSRIERQAPHQPPKPDVPMASAIFLVAARTGGTITTAAKALVDAARDGHLAIFGSLTRTGKTWDSVRRSYWNEGMIQLSSCLKQGSDDAQTESKTRNAVAFQYFHRLRVDSQQLEKLWPPRSGAA